MKFNIIFQFILFIFFNLTVEIKLKTVEKNPLIFQIKFNQPNSFFNNSITNSFENNFILSESTDREKFQVKSYKNYLNKINLKNIPLNSALNDFINKNTNHKKLNSFENLNQSHLTDLNLVNDVNKLIKLYYNRADDFLKIKDSILKYKDLKYFDNLLNLELGLIKNSLKITFSDKSTFNQKISVNPAIRSLKDLKEKFSENPVIGNERDLNLEISKNPVIRDLKDINQNIPKNLVIRNPRATRSRNITILGLFELSGKNGSRTDGLSELEGAKLAIRHINERKLLGKYRLNMLTNDTKCDPGVGIDTFFHALYTQKHTKMLMLLGSACSEVTESLAKIVPYWNMVQISYGATSPVLSDRKQFPLFFRTVAPDTSNNQARIAFVKRFGWDTVTVLSQNEDVYSLAVNDLVMRLEQANVTCSATITFAITDFKNQMQLLKHLDTRIIFGSFSIKVAPLIFCEAYNLGMYGGDYVWILHIDSKISWWLNYTSQLECTVNQFKMVVEGVLLISSFNQAIQNTTTLSNISISDFSNEFQKMNVSVSRFSPETYDAVWAMALAINATEQKWRRQNLTKKVGMSYFDYTRIDIATELYSQLQKLNFSGVSGPISFKGSDRLGTTAFHQLQGGDAKMVALYHSTMETLEFNCSSCVGINWVDNQVPISKRIFKTKIITINSTVFLIMATFSVLGILLAIVFLIFNFYFKANKSIKLSSPRLNNMTAFGCILVYTAVILLGVDTSIIQNQHYFAVLCSARVYLLSAGFSLAFGSMLTKTYRVHRIVIRSYHGMVKNKLLQDAPLILMICFLLLIDGLIVTIWVFVDPMHYQLRNLTIELSNLDRSVAYQTQVEVCISRNTNGWLSALYTYKGMLLIVGIYMAWETRLVKIPLLNESESIGMSVYCVVITSAIVIVIVNLISEQVTLAFLIVTTLILVSTTCVLCLLFFPKVNVVLKNEQSDQVVDSLGLKIECNTRRLATSDDRNELRNRVEIQNSAFKKQIIALDLEINRLEKLLLATEDKSSSSGSSKASVLTLKAIKASQSEINYNACVTNKSLPSLFYSKVSVAKNEIPRASWPVSEFHSSHLINAVNFHSETKLNTRKQSLFGRIMTFFGKKVLNKHQIKPCEGEYSLDLSKIATSDWDNMDTLFKLSKVSISEERCKITNVHENKRKLNSIKRFRSCGNSLSNVNWNSELNISTIYTTSSIPNIFYNTELQP